MSVMAVALPVVVGCSDSHRRTRAAQILVRRVDHDIGVGRIMDGGDLAMLDADRLVDRP